jgi:hypothetical protein
MSTTKWRKNKESLKKNNKSQLTFEALKASDEDMIHYQTLSLNSIKLHNHSQAQTLD